MNCYCRRQSCCCPVARCPAPTPPAPPPAPAPPAPASTEPAFPTLPYLEGPPASDSWIGTLSQPPRIIRRNKAAEAPACGTIAPYFVSLTLPFLPNDEPRETAVASFDISEYQGTFLPVSAFVLDDFAFIVKSDFDVQSSYSLVGTTRTIALPPESLVVVDGNNPTYALGNVDDVLTTNYVFNGKTYSIPGGNSMPLSTAIIGVHQLGVPFQPHNQISLAQLQQLGFQNGSIVSFKIMSVAHGWGKVTLDINVPQCL